MARWVLPVLVGPSTAVTPAPRARPSRLVAGEKEIGIKDPVTAREGGGPLLYHNMTLESPVLNVWNEFERIAAESATRGAFEFVHCDIWK